MKTRINVTKTFLPNQDQYNAILKRAWDNSWITNRGELVLELEDKIKNRFGINNMIATTNGTLPLQIAIKALQLKGEIITTPFSYVATTSSIVWENCTPVFVDIDADHLTIDETKIEAKITSKTTAILATHVFGNPCHLDKIEAIAKQHNLKIIYDAAHCFGIRYKGKSIFNYGDVSTSSFHATKIFHTGEGGAIFCNDRTLHDTLYYHHNFGHNGPDAFHGLGINAKISELQAAMGLAVLPYFESILENRIKLYNLYLSLLKVHDNLSFQKIREFTDYNCSYFPVIFKSDKQLISTIEALNNEAIYPRRYFYPSLDSLPYVEKADVPISKSIASRILCLPLYFDLKTSEVKQIASIILKHL